MRAFELLLDLAQLGQRRLNALSNHGAAAHKLRAGLTSVSLRLELVRTAPTSVNADARLSRRIPQTAP